MAAQLEYDAVSIEHETIGIIGKLTATTEAGEPALGGQLVFTGAAIYYTYYLEVGVKATESDNNKKKGKASKKDAKNNDFEKTTDLSKKEEKLEKLVTLFEPYTWPGETATPPKTPPKPQGLNQVPL